MRQLTEKEVININGGNKRAKHKNDATQNNSNENFWIGFGVISTVIVGALGIGLRRNYLNTKGLNERKRANMQKKGSRYSQYFGEKREANNYIADRQTGTIMQRDRLDYKQEVAINWKSYVDSHIRAANTMDFIRIKTGVREI